MMTITITGPQGCGKTTLMHALLDGPLNRKHKAGKVLCLDDADSVPIWRRSTVETKAIKRAKKFGCEIIIKVRQK